MTDFVAYNSRWRIALIFLGAVGFVALGLWLAGAFGEVPSSRRYSASFTMGIGWLCILFFGLCALAAVKKFFDDNVQLLIGPSADGIGAHGIVHNRFASCFTAGDDFYVARYYFVMPPDGWTLPCLVQPDLTAEVRAFALSQVAGDLGLAWCSPADATLHYARFAFD